MRISARTRLFVEILKEEGERAKRLRDLLAMLQKDRISRISRAGSPTCAPEVIRFVKRIRDVVHHLLPTLQIVVRLYLRDLPHRRREFPSLAAEHFPVVRAADGIGVPCKGAQIVADDRRQKLVASDPT